MNLADLFTTASLSASISKLPYSTTRTEDLGIFAEVNQASTYVAVEYKNGRVLLVPNKSRHDDATQTKRDRRNRIIMETMHLPVQDVVLPDELQNLQPFGMDTTGRQKNPMVQVVNDRLTDLKNQLAVTREWLRIGALRGKLLDNTGAVYENLFTNFGITELAFNIAFTTASTDVRKALMEATRNAEQKLLNQGVMVTGYHAYCSKEFFDALTGHAKVQAAYANYQAAQDALGGDVRKGFTFAGITFEEYNCTVSGQDFIPANKARFFVKGRGIYQMINAPANYNETVNTLGQAYYAKAEERSMNKGWDLEAQSNPLAICLFPETLAEMTAT